MEAAHQPSAKHPSSRHHEYHASSLGRSKPSQYDHRSHQSDQGSIRSTRLMPAEHEQSDKD